MIRTFRGYLQRYKASLIGRRLYNDDIRKVMASYNNNYSRAIGMSPAEARLKVNWTKVRRYKEKQRLRQYLRSYKTTSKVQKFEKNDYVLMRTRTGDDFRKESDLRSGINVSNTLFQITEVVSDFPTESYRLQNMDTGGTYTSKVPGTRLLKAPPYFIKKKLQED